MKRLVCIISFLAFLLPFYAEENPAQNSVKWTLDDQGVLTITGRCPIADCLDASSPWAYFNEKIQKVTIEEGVTGIGAAAFSGCRNLTSVSIPNSVTYIGERAFYNCSALKSIMVPKKVTSIGNEAFYKCTSLTEAVLPNNLKEIPQGLFRKCSNLKVFSIPSSVTSIGNYAFEGCGNVDSFSIPEKVTAIGDGAFKGCNGIIEITIPEGVTVIGKETFYKCAFLEKVTISSSVKQIGRNAFNQCPRLVDVYINASSVPQVEGNPFGKNSKTIYVWVPSNRKRNYMHDKYWGQIMLRVENEEESNVTELKEQQEVAKEEKAPEKAKEQESPAVKEQTPSAVATTAVNLGTKYIVASSSNLNVRSAADSKASVIGSVHAGDTVRVLNTTGNWGQISYKSRTGYVSMSYLKIAAVQQGVDLFNSYYSPTASNNTQTQKTTSTTSSTTHTTTTATTSSSTSTSAPVANSTTTQSEGVSLGMFLDLTGDVGKNKVLGKTAGGIGIEYIVGFHSPRRRNFLGAGVGFQAVFCNPSKNIKATSLMLPIFANDKFYLTTSDNDPYIDLSLGGFVALMAKVNGENIKGEGGGFFFRSGLGIDIKGLNLAVGYELMFQEKIDNAVHMVYFKVGLGSR